MLFENIFHRLLLESKLDTLASSRLFQNIREKQGLAYYAYSDLRAGVLAGPWWVRAGVSPKNEERAVESILQEVRAFRESSCDGGEEGGGGCK